ncbi:hypothetical protein GF358_02435, partial [Candidatus Woesearchaeota archaeon]|nr:hypothetical protein [Candidatus Woesearchaeota archaeon]
MYCWSKFCGNETFELGAAPFDRKDENPYFIIDDKGNSVRVGINEYLHNLVVDQFSMLSNRLEKGVGGKSIGTIKDVISGISQNLLNSVNTTQDRTLHSKALLLSFWLTNTYVNEEIASINDRKYRTDEVVHDIDLFESLESHIYEGI